MFHTTAPPSLSETSGSVPLDDLVELAPELIWLEERGVDVRALPDAPVGRRADDRPVLYLVPAGAAPPPCGPCEDWTRRPLRAAEVVARAERLLALGTSAPEVAAHLEDDVLHVDGQVVLVSAQEAKVLEVLLREPGRLVTREEITAHVWPGERPADERAVDNRVKTLRRRLHGHPVTIHTVHGRGLLLELRRPT
ncbi:MAG: winged helix-turn-helix domain-containing protein [Acidimicrobiales bacterium]|nr:winged helix-turn-helix transcriptional regulator [Acidimicrobiales bacterium]